MECKSKGREWITSTGGPLILIDELILPKWKGSTGTETSNSSGFDTDYERACEVNDYVGLINIGNSKALVFGDEPMQSTWFQISKNEGFIVRLEYADSEEQIEEVFQTISFIQEWENIGVEITFDTGNLVLIDSSSSYDQLEEKLSIKIDSGQYIVQTQFYKPNEKVSLLLHRLSNLTYLS